MFESEVNPYKKCTAELPADIMSKFREYKKIVTARTTSPWSEHCVECVWPTCYSTCSLYDPREDKACRLFVDGMQRIDNNGGLNSYIIKLRLKKWGKLWTPGTVRGFSVTTAFFIEAVNIFAGRIATSKILPSCIRVFLSTNIYKVKKRLFRIPVDKNLMDSFLIEVYNPNSVDVGITISIRPDCEDVCQMFFQEGLILKPGFNRFEVPVVKIGKRVDLTKSFSMDISYDQKIDRVELYFGFMDFITKANESQNSASKQNKIKCVVWDLDNTIWDGILIEDGISNIFLKEKIRDVIVELDSRGILQSVASKNKHEDAMAAIKKFALEEYFLYPQISWDPKSESIKKIAKALNIGIETFLFVDDQMFEREEVKAGCKGINILDSLEYLKIPDLEECNLPKTAEAKNRRKMYRQEERRSIVMANGSEDYMDFLKTCQLKMKIGSLNESNEERVYELAQRTNQMNFSGNRYSREVLKAMQHKDSIETMVIECEDIYGSYGIVGFSVIDLNEMALIDLMFSCRIQSKRAEHALLTYVLSKHLHRSVGGFKIHYKKTEKNTPSSKVFDEMGFVDQEKVDDVIVLSFPQDKSVPDDKLYTMETE